RAPGSRAPGRPHGAREPRSDRPHHPEPRGRPRRRRSPLRERMRPRPPGSAIPARPFPEPVRRRLDAELVRRGLAASRSEGTQAITAGRIRVSGRRVDKPSALVAPDEPVTVEGPAKPYVSRGGEKLEGAL